MTTEAIERGRVCPDGTDHYLEHAAEGDRVVGEVCTRCGQKMNFHGLTYGCPYMPLAASKQEGPDDV